MTKTAAEPHRTTAAPPTTTLTSTALIRALMTVKPAVKRKSTIPILSMVRMQAAGGTLTLTSTNLDLGMITRIPASGNYDKVVPPRLLLAFLRTLPKKAEVTLAAGDHHSIRVTSGNFTARIDGMSPESWPCLPEVPTGLMLPGKALQRMISQTRGAICLEESRFTLNGLRIRTGAHGIELAATDGHRMHVATEEGAYGEHRSLVQAQALTIVEAMAKAGDVHMAMDDNHHFFTDGTTTLIARKLTGNLPAIEKVLEHEYTGETALPLAQTIEAFKSVSVFADACVRVLMKDGKMTLSAKSLDTGEASGYLDCEYAGELTIGLNAGYLIDMLKVCHGPSVLMRFTDAASQIEISEPGFRAVLMPMRM